MSPKLPPLFRIVGGEVIKNCVYPHKHNYFIKPRDLKILKFAGKSETIALEVELSAKSKRRYESIFLKHLFSKEWDVIFYMAKDKALRTILMSNLKKIKEENILLRNPDRINDIYFCLVDEFTNKGLSTLFIDENVEFSLLKLEKNNPLKKETH